MKNLNDAAMDAIAAGTAIVTGALQIYTRGSEPIEVPGGTDIVYSWYQAGDSFAFPDAGRGGFAFLDADGDQMGSTVWSPMVNAAAGIWTPKSVSGSSPVGAATLRLFMEMERRAGVTADQGFDALALSVGGLTATLVNPGAETGDTTGWTTPTFGPLAVTNSLFGAGPQSGSWFFTGGANIYVSAQQDVSLSAFVPVDPVPPEPVISVWGGYGPLEIEGVVYQGIGARGLVQQTAGARGGIAQGLVLTLSGIEPRILELLDDVDLIKGGAVVMRRLIFAGDGKTLLDSHVWDRGRLDTVDTDLTIGGEASIRAAVESAARSLGRSLARQRSDADQRLIDANDGYFRFAAYMAEIMLYWGGRRPHRSGDATGGSFGGVSISSALRS